MATAFMLAHPYGMPRIMSSFEYNRANNYEGPPHNGDMSIKSVTLNGMICGGGWSCEHRFDTRSRWMFGWRISKNLTPNNTQVTATCLQSNDIVPCPLSCFILYSNGIPRNNITENGCRNGRALHGFIAVAALFKKTGAMFELAWMRRTQLLFYTFDKDFMPTVAFIG